MDDSLVSQIQAFEASQSRSFRFPPASQRVIANTERQLGFKLPELLKSIYSEVGNGGFGPGRGGTIIGLKGGYDSDLGTLVEAYAEMQTGQAFDGLVWPSGLLPFCEWGCNIFSCVDCNTSPYLISVSEECVVAPQGYSLEHFVQLWLNGTDILSYEETETESMEIINPFTGQKSRISRRRRK